MCTSFAAYHNKPLYGMNIDHFERERKFKITKLKCNNACPDKEKCASCYLREHEMIRFHSQGLENGRFLDGACMNSCGLFSAYLYLVRDTDIPMPKSNKMAMHSAFTYAQNYSGTIDDVKQQLVGREIYSNKHGNFGLHSIFADPYGSAFILEESSDGKGITDIENRHLVVTNFPVCEFQDAPLEKIIGDGDQRYIDTYRELEERKPLSSVEDAFQVLAKSCRTGEYFSTVCSMVFEPLTLSVYIALDTDFKKTWKVSLQDGFMVSYSGFDKEIKIKMGSKGILASSLHQYYQ